MYGRADGMPSFQLTVAVRAQILILLQYDSTHGKRRRARERQRCQRVTYIENGSIVPDKEHSVCCLRCAQRMLMNATRAILYATAKSASCVEDLFFQYVCIPSSHPSTSLGCLCNISQSTSCGPSMCGRLSETRHCLSQKSM